MRCSLASAGSAARLWPVMRLGSGSVGLVVTLPGEGVLGWGSHEVQWREMGVC